MVKGIRPGGYEQPHHEMAGEDEDLSGNGSDEIAHRLASRRMASGDQGTQTQMAGSSPAITREEEIR
jgi:hypothetical protein